MARGITELDVHGAADALVAKGERPTVERVRAHLGTGSPALEHARDAVLAEFSEASEDLASQRTVATQRPEQVEASARRSTTGSKKLRNRGDLSARA